MSNEKEKMIKSFVNSRLIKTREVVKVNFTSLKDFLASVFHFIYMSLFNIFVMDLKISAKLGINILRKFILPMKD